MLPRRLPVLAAAAVALVAASNEQVMTVAAAPAEPAFASTLMSSSLAGTAPLSLALPTRFVAWVEVLVVSVPPELESVLVASADLYQAVA